MERDGIDRAAERSAADRIAALERWQNRHEQETVAALDEHLARIGSLETSNLIILGCIVSIALLVYMQSRKAA